MIELYKRINEVARQLPELPKKQKKNFFDILGVQRKETINSKLLAYFFDPEEDHGFGTLFIDALVSILDLKLDKVNAFEKFTGQFEVSTEVTTSNAVAPEDQSKRIDLLLTGIDWSIIIENKLYHYLSNPLDVYFQHVNNSPHNKEENIIGVVLSLEPIIEEPNTQRKPYFINITHRELITKVQQKLILSHIESDIDVFYLREYAKTINSHYRNKMNEPELNKLIGSLIEQKEAINEIFEKRKAAITFLDKEIEEVFTERDYKSVKSWYCHKKNENLCFCINPTDEILKYNKISVGFELWNDLLKKVGRENLAQIQSTIQNGKMEKTHLNFDVNNDHAHMNRIVTYRKDDFLSENRSLKSELGSILDSYFFNENGIEDVVLKQIGDAL
ncbi:PD-(D/E)XK nuclease family protein [Maribacter luteus]|uniref:PD-(D/E)XK nuclease family protein n=1 Tax=Maribacter luteus TaxID=2594478 RepID=A0A6I2MFT1_9FLAO|nr:PD-(D/E)XK nuclease family protein [Maribacter luteus]MRX62588.1 hypothetical protein [Maribacter luteus]